MQTPSERNTDLIEPTLASPPKTVGPSTGGGSVPRPHVRRLGLNSAVCFGASLLVLAIAGVLTGFEAPGRIINVIGIGGTVLFAFSTLLAFYRVIVGIGDLVRPPREQVGVGVGRKVALILGNLAMGSFGMFVAYLMTAGFARGRQLRRFGRILLPRLRSSSSWTTSELPAESLENVPSGVADQWRENGKTEHASVAAFARLTLDLMALGAPPTLIRAANQDALDEIRHAELCFSLARSLDGKSVSPAPFPEVQRVASRTGTRVLALAGLAVDSLVDGALHEGVSARVIAKLADRCDSATIRAVLKELAADEGRHAAHGWAVVEWCLAEGGNPVAEALLGAIRALPRQIRSELPEPAAGGGWERFGIHGHHLEAEEYGSALAHLIARVRARVTTLAREAA